MRISDWSSDVCSSDLILDHPEPLPLKRMGEVCPSEPTELWFRPFTKKKIADLTSEEVAALRVKAQERAVSLNKNVVPMKTHSYLGEDHGHPIITTKATYGPVYIIRDPRHVAVPASHHSARTTDAIP